MKEKIFIYGASGHAKVVIDIVERQGLHEVAFLVDDNPALKGCEFFGYPVLGGKEALLAQKDIRKGLVAIGSNQARARVAQWLLQQGFELATAVHPSAQIGRSVQVGSGTVIMAGSVVNSDTVIGRNVIVNTRASIDHDCRIGDNVHVAPGATLCGTVAVGHNSFIAAGSTVTPNLAIGNNVTVGAGAVVIRNLQDGVTAVGVPAREIIKGRTC